METSMPVLERAVPVSSVAEYKLERDADIRMWECFQHCCKQNAESQFMVQNQG